MFLNLQNVTKRFGDLTAVNAVNLEIQEGELICFLGPSGCGKTTLLRLIAGLEETDGGDVQLGGEDLSKTPERDRNFGMVFQSYSLFPNMTVGKNVAYGLECRNWSKDLTAKRVAEMLGLVHLKDQVDKFPSQLSGGQQQRVALARALAPGPHVLLLDEPLSALDAKVRATLRLEVRQLQQSLGITTIMVTHDQEEALTMADRIVVMNAGAIEQVGTPAEIYGVPKTAFVADFIGTMNFLSAQTIDTTAVNLAGRRVDCANWQVDAVPDDKVLMAIRPEDIRLLPPGTPDENMIDACVTWVEFLGSTHRIELRIGEGDAAQKLQIELSAAAMRELNLSVGTKVLVEFPTDRIWVYPPKADINSADGSV